MASKKIETSVLKSVLHLEVSKGHLRWKVSDLARTSKVSRPLIYYHFGNTKNDILVSSIKILAREYFGLNESRAVMMKTGDALGSIMDTRNSLMKHPDVITFYFKWRTSRTKLQKYLIEIETEYQALLATAFPRLSRNQIAGLHGLFFGLVTAPFLTRESIAREPLRSLATSRLLQSLPEFLVFNDSQPIFQRAPPRICDIFV